MTDSMQKIRPAARLLRTIGSDLIKDVYAAIVELVKNAYDADSPEATVGFTYVEERHRLLIRVEDTGHGMDFDTVINKWLVPATDDKLLRKRSDKGRVLQGRKGIGRFSASVLGERILLETTRDGETTSLIIDMDELEQVDYLDQFQLDISREKTGKPSGTIIEIEKDSVTPDLVREIWTSKQLRKLLIELRSLISPEEVFKAASSQGYVINHDKFEIGLKFQDFPVEEYSDREIKVEPFPVLDLYDYRISGTVDRNGRASLRFENQNIPSLPPEESSLKITLDTDNTLDYPGEAYIDLRVYDRDPDSIANIISRGLKDPDTGEFVGKNEARRILDEYYGVGVYREQFRIRPYGEQSFDWLDLDKQRVQDPSRKLGHNQVIGFVYIRSEEESGLTEKSARDGLTENKYYYGLRFIVSRLINQLEVKRYKYRDKARKGGRHRTIEDDINHLFDFGGVTREINKELDELGMPRKQRDTVNKVIGEALEKEKQKKSDIARRIKDTVAVYQGQATLGKITHVLLHEGRKNIKYISETIPRVIKWSKDLSISGNDGLASKLDDRGEKVITHAKGLAYLFKKIEPLARTKRSPARKFDLCSVIENSFGIFSAELSEIGITYEIKKIDASEYETVANEMDLITVFSNLIENSVYWLKHKKDGEKKIIAHLHIDNGGLVVEYSDNGPGFQGGNLELMFEPGYSMKPDGTGLGLALAGEAMSRIGGTIEAKHSENGAFFDITFKAQSK